MNDCSSPFDPADRGTASGHEPGRDRLLEKIGAWFHRPPAIIEQRQAEAFIPCHPEPPRRDPNLVQLVLGARRNLIEGWTSKYYRTSVDSFRILRRQIVFVNDPDWVRHVFVTRHDNYERKSPQMRRALEALLGDGLFISDSETWKRRRPLVADIVHKRRLPEFGHTMEEAALAVASVLSPTIRRSQASALRSSSWTWPGWSRSKQPLVKPTTSPWARQAAAIARA